MRVIQVLGSYSVCGICVLTCGFLGRVRQKHNGYECKKG